MTTTLTLILCPRHASLCLGRCPVCAAIDVAAGKRDDPEHKHDWSE